MQAEPVDETRTDVRSRIVAAAAGLLGRGGVPAMTTRAVAQAAGVQPPVIFRIFGDKAGLLQAVAEHVITRYASDKATNAAGEDGDPVEDLRAAWQVHIDFGLSNPEVFLLLAEPGELQRSPAVNAGAEVLRTRVGRVAAAGRLAMPEERAVEMIRAAGTGAVLTLLSRPEADRNTGLTEELLHAVLGRILTTAPAPPASDPLAVLNTFRATMPDLPAFSPAERTLLTEWLDRAITQLSTRHQA